MRMVKVRDEYNIIFDLDGTLVHTAPALTKAANSLLRELNLPEISTEVYSSFEPDFICVKFTVFINY